MEESKMKGTQKLVVLGGSAGGLHAIFSILEKLTPGFRIPILIVLHRASNSDSSLMELLVGKTHLTVSEIEEKEEIKENHLYLCPSDYHVLIEKDESFSLDASEKVNYSRPSLDVVFRSAADVFKDRLVAVLLSGANADGAEGLMFVQQLGGITIVQDPSDAQVAYMPQQAMLKLKPHKVLKGKEIGEYINGLNVNGNAN
jgi:two-component system chemotaxis response regulator CheB